MKAFDRALAFLWRPDIEGEHSAPRPGDPHDTWYGLARRWNQDLPWPPTREQAAARYRERYWDKIEGDQMPWPLALVVFDAAVQHDTVDAIRFLQRALVVEVDGVIGPQTRRAIQRRNALMAAEEIIALRMMYYPELSTWKANRHGWSRRLVALHREMLSGVGGAG